MTETSRLLTKTPIKTARPILIEHNIFFINLYFDGIIVLITIENQLLRKNDKLPQSTGDNLFTRVSLVYAYQRILLFIQCL